MIDWGALAAAIFWVAGLALLLGATSLALHRASLAAARRYQSTGTMLRGEVQRARYRRGLFAGLALVFTGLAMSSAAWWERTAAIVGLLLAAGSLLRELLRANDGSLSEPAANQPCEGDGV